LKRRVFRSRHVVVDGAVRAAAVHVAGGVIAAVTEYDDVAPDDDVLELGERVLLPGLVDTHVHVNEPGRTEWEGYATATDAAAAGGVTTVVDMPLNAIPATTSVPALAVKRAAAAGRCRVDLAFWGGIVPGNESEVNALLDAGVVGFKCFLVDSGVPEFGAVGEAELRRVLPLLAERDAPLLVHAELPGLLREPAAGSDPRRHASWLATRPAAAEIAAVELLVRLCRDTGARVHIVHVSGAGVLPVIAAARAEGLPVTAETCPHYLALAAEDVPDGATEYKCAPPIRGAANRDALWRGLAEGVLDLIASDHSPAPPALKARDTGDFLAAWGGIASLQLGLSVVWTEARARGHGIADLARWLAESPARLAGLDHRKGRIAPGWDADLVVFDPAAEWTVRPGQLRHRHALTPYAGRALHGVVTATCLRGETIHEHGELAQTRFGELLIRREPTWTSPR
jgi:allantoinase